MHYASRSIAVCVCVAALVQGCASDADREDSLEENQQALTDHVPVIPPEIAVPEGAHLAFVRFGDGVQIYDCKSASEGAAAAWTFRAPRAELYTIFGWPAGTHYAGPTWEARDGSTVVGARKASANVDASSIPWLLLQASAHGGSGRMTDITYVQRLFTQGGNAPAGSCDQGASVEVPYTALYVFYR